MFIKKSRNIFFLLFIFSYFLGAKSLFSQVRHEEGFLLRCLLGVGIGGISDLVGNPATGTAFRSSVSAGGFLFEDFALQGGLDHTSSSNVEYEGRADQALRGGSYSHLSLNAGLSYFLTGLGLYLSLEGRYTVAGNYKLKAFVLQTQPDGTKVLADGTDLEGKFSEEENKLGWGLIFGTEEWLLNNNTALGIALTYSYDSPLGHTFYGLSLSLSYNK